MSEDHDKALKRATVAAVSELAKMVPGVGPLIEGIAEYHRAIEESQREALIEHLRDRMDYLVANREWYQSDEGSEFVKKVVATCLNAEYADKIELLANCLVQGPTVSSSQAVRMKLVEIVRQVSRPALEVLGASLRHIEGTGQVAARWIAPKMGWQTALVDACIRELYAVGAYSSVMRWSTTGGPADSFSEGTPGVSEITRLLGELVSDPTHGRA